MDVCSLTCKYAWVGGPDKLHPGWPSFMWLAYFKAVGREMTVWWWKLSKLGGVAPESGVEQSYLPSHTLAAHPPP